ncbi:MAG: TIGR00159 family protein [Deltaproteobacteria bacterium RBG_13_65_10]|nr:MAG: TIGR00159 family protein [Deltaproteobacteria bacterium RBG_13_65_10]
MLEFLKNLTGDFSLKDAVDILIVASGIYWLLLLIRGTRAVQMLVGLFILICALVGSQYFQLYTLQWVLDKFLGSLVIVIVVIFQHDIRRALTKVGRGIFYPQLGRWEETQILEDIVRAATSCATKRIGALIVLERETGLENFVEMGEPLDAKVSKNLLVSIFMPGAPMHDGAVILQRGRILAARCILPLTLNPEVDREIGTRHRAALGLTEETDAVVIVVSEQTGQITLVEGGQMHPAEDAAELRRLLQEALVRNVLLKRGGVEEGIEVGVPAAPPSSTAVSGREGARSR